MGQTITYFKNNFNKGLKDLIFEYFDKFRQWYLDTDQLSIDEVGEPLGNKMLKGYLISNPDFKNDFDKLNKKLIDELTSEFIGSYCDTIDRESKILELFGPMVSKWRYEESSEMVLKTNDDGFLRLWNFLIQGRSLKDNTNFDSFTNDYKIGFLTFSEQEILKAKIETHFGNIEQINHRFWNDPKNSELQKIFKNKKSGTHTLAGYDPKTLGLEYILLVLAEIAEYKNDLITAIE